MNHEAGLTDRDFEILHWDFLVARPRAEGLRGVLYGFLIYKGYHEGPAKGFSVVAARVWGG